MSPDEILVFTESRVSAEIMNVESSDRGLAKIINIEGEVFSVCDEVGLFVVNLIEEIFEQIGRRIYA